MLLFCAKQLKLKNRFQLHPRDFPRPLLEERYELWAIFLTLSSLSSFTINTVLQKHTNL